MSWLQGVKPEVAAEDSSVIMPTECASRHSVYSTLGTVPAPHRQFWGQISITICLTMQGLSSRQQ